MRNLDKWSEARVEYMHKNLCEIKDNEWADVQTVWTKPHITEEMWENYIWMFDGKDVLPEQKLLTRARKKLKLRVRRLIKQYKEFREKESATKKIAAEKRAGG